MEVSDTASVANLFITEVYSAVPTPSEAVELIKPLDTACRQMAREHIAGREWSAKNGYVGYTSYPTIKNLATHAPVFARLKSFVDEHVAAFAKVTEFELSGRPLRMQECWVNVLGPMGSHAGHIHARSVISGTFYVAVPQGSGGIQFEDPRLPMLMHSPGRSPAAQLGRKKFVALSPEPGALLLWESWLRHEVLPNRTNEPRISISFNYDLV